MPGKKAERSSEEPQRKQITLRDIAKELGISHVTVSLALRDHPRISAATKLRVQQKAEEIAREQAVAAKMQQFDSLEQEIQAARDEAAHNKGAAYTI